jgi:hypothetical protein
METVRIRDPGWKKVGSGIRDKHPGSATLLETVGAGCVACKSLNNTVFSHAHCRALPNDTKIAYYLGVTERKRKYNNEKTTSKL